MSSPDAEASVIVIVAFAVLFPSDVVPVIVALPTAFAVTNPVVETVATPVLLLDHFTALLVAFDGETCAVNCCVPFIDRFTVAVETLTPETATVLAEIVTLVDAAFPPSAVFTVITVVPAALAVTSPDADT